MPPRPEHIVELARAYGRDLRGDLAIALWKQEIASVSSGDQQEDASRPPLPELYSAALEACAASGELQLAYETAKSFGWNAPPCRAGQAALLTLARWLARRQEIG